MLWHKQKAFWFMHTGGVGEEACCLGNLQKIMLNFSALWRFLMWRQWKGKTPCLLLQRLKNNTKHQGRDSFLLFYSLLQMGQYSLPWPKTHSPLVNGWAHVGTFAEEHWLAVSEVHCPCMGPITAIKTFFFFWRALTMNEDSERQNIYFLWPVVYILHGLCTQL